MAHIEDNQQLSQPERPSEQDRVVEGGLEAGAEVGAGPSFESSTAPSEDSKDASVIGETEQSLKAQNTAPASVATATASPNMNGPARPTLVQLGSSTSASPATQHKKFSASNINKKFLEKTSSVSGSAPTALNSSIHKTSGPISRPSATTASSHSRLVTAKLTAAPQSSSPGPGWSRPSSATPPVATSASPTLGSAPNGTASLPPGSVAAPSASAAPPSPASTNTPSSASQLPHAGKVIQPQPRSALLQAGGVTAKPNSKPVWGNVKATAAVAKPISDPKVQADFPTAAEVAQGVSLTRKSKQMESKVDEVTISSKQLRNEEADTFRGVHLDPNAHHWDEMPEDDDNFLDGVIEFGDGRQYKVESATIADSPPLSPSSSRVDPNGTLDSRHPPADVPVSKEERFADDFDRSWPRSKPSPAISTRGLSSSIGSHHAPPSASASPISSHQHYSPTENSRVLFNERSNRLEPYSGSNNFRPGPDHAYSKKSDHSTSPTEFRRGRDLPPHHAQGNVQLLQKQGGESHSGPRGHPGGGYGHRERDQFHARKEPPHSAPFPSRSPRITDSFGLHDLSGPSSTREREAPADQTRGRRPHSNMGPPPVPSHARDSGRQLPPHLSQTSPLVQPGRLSFRESGYPPPASAKHSATLPSQSPVLSHASPATATGLSPAMGPPQNVSVPEIDDIRKDLMHDAAERAKQRRQAEEAEREKERERARLKAAQLEGMLNTTEAERSKQQVVHEKTDQETAVKEAEVISVIEDAIKSVDPYAIAGQPDAGALLSPPVGKPPLKRPPSLRGVPRQTVDSTRPGFSKRNSNLPVSPTSATTPAAQAESWRSRTNPLSTTPSLVPSKPPIPSFSPPTLSVLQQVESSLAENPDEDLEIVDFSELGKFVGVPESHEEAKTLQTAEMARTKLSRPVAIDFFDEQPVQPAAVPVSPVWRRRSITQQSEPAHKESSIEVNNSGGVVVPSPKHLTFNVSTASAKDSASITNHHNGPVQVVTPLHAVGHSQPRTPRSQTFSKEATMSALDDAMLRIKGAIDGMHETHKGLPLSGAEEASGTHTQQSPSSHKNGPPPRWVPPALRSHQVEPVEAEPLVTRLEPPPSPKPAWNTYHVRLPKMSIRRELPNKQQLYWFQRGPHPRSVETLSIDPPVSRANRRDFTVNDILFGKPGFKGKQKYQYRVHFPRLARVSVASARVSGNGAFGKPSGADGSASWRKSASSSFPPTIAEELETTSRSPPPDAIVSGDINVSNVENNASTKLEVHPPRPKSQRKMPAGSAVAVYRDSRIDVLDIDAKAGVNFIVGSELDDSAPITDEAQNLRIAAHVKPVPAENQSVSEHKENHSNEVTVNGDGFRPSDVPPFASNKPGSKSSDTSTDHGPITPSSHSSSLWANPTISFPVKEPSAREGVDLPRIKDLWSSISEKPSHPTVNSLERIEDDLPALPLTLQDVKSEGGETPPPSSTNTRMSQYDVTRGFQQVPTSTTTPTVHRSPLSPATTSAPIARPPSYAYPMATTPSTNWPAMYSYSPMMAHSPAPVIYPGHMASSPVPSRMVINGQSPYGQAAWMPPPQSAGQSHAMVRQMPPSPYPAHLAPYPAPGTPTMYAASSVSMQAPQPPPTSNTQSRVRNPSMNSPVVTHANTHAFYPNGPMLMQTAMHLPQNHVYMPDPSRGQMRHDNGHTPMQPHPGYGPTSSTSFSRPSW